MEKQQGYRALGISFFSLGVSLAVVFGLTLGWAFAPMGLSFIALGLVFFNMKGDEE